MESKPKCSKCHRTLTNPISIAAGMGPKCRGGGGGHGRSKKLKAASNRCHKYDALGPCLGQLPLPIFVPENPGQFIKPAEIIVEGVPVKQVQNAEVINDS